MARRQPIKVTKICPICNKEFSKTTIVPWKVKFCSDKCSDKDYRNRKGDSEKQRVKKWRKENKERYNQHHREYREKNKDKINQRRRKIAAGDIMPNKTNIKSKIKVTKVCPICKLEYTSISENANLKIYCSDKCSSRAEYIKDQEKIRIRQKASREKPGYKAEHNRRNKKSYEKNREKYSCRQRTLRLIKKFPELIQYICHKCGETKDLELHHQKYPQEDEEIIQAIKEGYIYYLCLHSCHPKHHQEKNFKNKIKVITNKL